MQNTDVSGEKKFKKRSHRPWKPSLLANTISDSSSELNVNHTSTTNATNIDANISHYAEDNGHDTKNISNYDATPELQHEFDNTANPIEQEVSVETLKQTISKQFDSLSKYPTSTAENNYLYDRKEFIDINYKPNTSVDFADFNSKLKEFSYLDNVTEHHTTDLLGYSNTESPTADPVKADLNKSDYYSELENFNSYLQKTEFNHQLPQNEPHNANLNQNKAKTKANENTVNKNKQRRSLMSIGGFFQPNYLSSEGKPMQNLNTDGFMSDFNWQESEINSFANELKVSQALEQAEKAEMARKLEEQAKIAAEKRMKHALEQANATAKQFKAAIERIQRAEKAHIEESKLRNFAEMQAAKTIEQIKNTEFKLRAEHKARLNAEEKAQHALNQTVQTELSRQELEKTKKDLERQTREILEELKRTELARKSEEAARQEAEHKMQTIFQEKVKLEKIYKDEKANAQRAFQEEKLRIEKSLDASNKNILAAQQQIQLLEKQLQDAHGAVEQKNKLLAILEAEKSLRIMAEKKAKEALAKAEAAEVARQAEERQRRLVDERAKRAVAHASKTVMHFLNAPLDENLQESLDLQDKQQA